MALSPTFDLQEQPCGCSLINRCDHHGRMMADIHDAWTSGSNAACEVIWSLSDGYGSPGFIPEQGYDWSGIRDSSVEAVEAMFRAVHA
jgi:hypothetical protein